MQIHIHIHHHGPKGDKDVLHNVYTLTKSIHTKINQMTPELQRLTDEVAELKTVSQSAKALLQNLSQMIRDRANDPAAINALADDLDGETKSLADAVAANTPAGAGTGEEGPISPNPGGDTGGGPTA